MIEVAVFAVYGLVFGSFVNVLIYRLPKGETVVRGRSHCVACGKTIKARDLIPVLSWLMLGGKCRYCKTRISPVYPLTELAVGVLFTIAALRFTLPLSAGMAAFFAALTAVCVIDLRHQIIPDSLNVFIALIGAAALFVRGSAVGYIVGALVISVPMLVVAVVTNGFGFGDVKLLAACGLLLGWRLALLMGFVAFISGGITAIALLVTKRVKRKTAVPFGPFICIGAVVAAVCGDTVIDWYVHLLM